VQSWITTVLERHARHMQALFACPRIAYHHTLGGVPPHVTTGKTVPPEVARYLDGTGLLAAQALRLSTVDAAGWPHAALLSG
jgi:hypothetical protein